MALKKTEIPREGLKIGNTYIKIGHTYECAHKFDGTAPDGMQEIRATKFPLAGVAEKRGLYFDERRGTYDTGFYKESVCNSGLVTADNPDELINLYNKHIKEPYEKRMNVDCSETNNKFWDSYKYEVKVNKSYDTSDPKELFDLFHALKQGAICNEGEKDSTLQKANYTIKNIAEVKSKEDEKLENKYAAISTFENLVSTDIEKLYTTLEYLQAPNVRSMQKDVLRKTYLRVLDDSKKGTEFVNRFISATDKYNSEQGKMEMEYFSAVQDLHRRNKIVKKQGSFHAEDGSYLANTIKDIALKCVTNLEFRGIIDSIVEKYTEE